MKRIIVLLIALSLVLTGCSDMNKYSVDQIVEKVMKKNLSVKNVNIEGYSYYVPRGMKFLNKNQFNAYLKDQNGNNYYLYVDLVSRYHKTKKKYKVNKNSFYSKEVKTKNKFGYLEINEIDNKYFIEAMYNYMKIEAYVEKDDLNDAVTNVSMILSSVKYNEKVLDTIVGENILNYKEESYNIFETKKNTNDFLDYVEEYDSEASEKDEDSIQIEKGE